jgi:hypothetical protein
MAGWQRRLRRLDGTCRRRAGDLPGPPPATSARPGHEAPFPLFRRSLRRLVASLYRQDAALSAADRHLLLELARLEIDAYQERISDLAGRVNPYRTPTVARLLPLLSRADAEVRDLREFLDWIEAGELDRAFHERRPRLLDVMDEREAERFLDQLQEQPHLAAFADMLRSLVQRTLPVPLLAAAAARLMAVTHQLHVRGLRDGAMDLFTAVLVVQQRERDGEVVVALPAARRAEVEAILDEQPAGAGIAGWPRDGFAVRGKRLVLRLQDVGPGDRHWPDDLPAVHAGDDDGSAEPGGGTRSTAELKKLVLSSVESVSVLLGFLRNPKIVAVPGLVADVVRRTRSVLVLETVARDRRLHTGFANRDVPLALLCSPCNVPIKTLRKFIHVKHVSKMDLQRMARDRAGVRDEVGREIQAYLRSLV